MSTLRLVLVVALLLPITLQIDSICLSCATAIGGTCVACNTGSCAAYASIDTSGMCSCNSGYYLNSATTGSPYCDRCYIGCLTCSGPLASNCLTCSTAFTFDANTSKCLPPSTSKDYTLQQAYYFLGFNLLGSWSWATTASGNLLSSSSVYTCGSTTLVGLASGQRITASYSGLQTHFQVRVMFAHYTRTTSTSQNVQIVLDGGAVNNVAISTDIGGSNNPQLCSGYSFIQSYIDSSYTHSATTLTVGIGASSGTWWGIKEFIVILKLCNSQCSVCNDYTASNCTACTDTRRVTNQSSYPNQCLCHGTSSNVGLYYQEPTAGTCVLLCPALPTETFGDNLTRNCLTQCPNNSYAYTDLYRCWANCPKTSIVSGALLFQDKDNWRCVPNCPSSSPYGNEDDGTCYLNCPNTTNSASTTNYYAVDGNNPRCVSTCPYNSSYWLFGYQGKCIPRCPTGTWGDPASKLCLANCDNATAAPFPFKDSSSGINVCVADCPYSNYFRDNSTFTCVLACPSPKFGETNRECIPRCTDGSFGLPFGNRKCVAFCPDGYWGEPDANVCVDTPAQCWTATNKRYADNYTRTCVFPIACSLGYYADNATQACVSACPSAPSPSQLTGATVGHPISRICQLVCATPYFADYVAGLCVTSCLTNGTFADVDSGRTCVTACNSAGATPWAYSYDSTCVSVCNTVNVPTFVADNITFSCVFNCPANYYADKVTTTAYICRPVCRFITLGNGTQIRTYADNSTGTGLCVQRCSEYPVRFGDGPAGNLCVALCTDGLVGDQTGNRECVTGCPVNYFAQNESTIRQCVLRCKPYTYGWNRVCYPDPHSCPANTFANDENNLCDGCNSSLGTWGDPVSKRCVVQCPLNTSFSLVTSYADVSIRQCVLTCNASYTSGATTTYTSGLFGNNNTRTCEFICLDKDSYAEVQANNPYRVCVARCFPVPVFHYANNQTRVCVTSIDCPYNQFGLNSTQQCVEECPSGSFAYETTLDKLCIDICPLTWFGDNSTNINICVQNCPSIPPLFADPTTKLCVPLCPSTYYADSTTRTCVQICPANYYSFEPNRTCEFICPNTYYANQTVLVNTTIVGQCVAASSLCGPNLWGDAYLHKCVSLCSGPSPVSLYGYWPDCVAICPNTYYANTYNGVRICVKLCPPGTKDVVLGLAAPNLYGDNSTKTCVANCVTPLTWADPQTRLCEPICSATPFPTYSENFHFTCVTALNCPTSPSMTYGDNNTRSCVSNCSLGTFGDPVSRSCVPQCPNDTTTSTSTYYGDISTGQYICVVICPILPRLFGRNQTNRCVDVCPIPLYGDQTGNRTCVAYCPLIGAVVHFAQNTSRICVTVCITGTWGYVAQRACVETPFNCLAQWADNTTNLCVDVCPATAGSFADPTTKFCVTFCPSTYYSDYSTRTCVQRCPDGVYLHGTFGNNQTRTCEEDCSPINGTLTFADPQTPNRYCVLACVQTPSQAFADPSTRSCVPACPAYPDLYGETVTFTCVATCANGTYADTNTRLCSGSCPASFFKLNGPNLCVSVCPADGLVPLFGDLTGVCVDSCTSNYFRYNALSICISTCTSYSLLAYNMTCTQFCPKGYYANSSGICVATCPSSTFGENTTTTCRSTCLTGFASGSLCLAVCPTGTYGENGVCVTSCQVSGNVATSVGNACVSNCTNGSYAQAGQCNLNCTSGTYADPLTNTCEGTACSNSNYYADPSTNTCVLQCPPNYYKDAGFCVLVCTGSNFADNITWTCVPTCSTGYWGLTFLCLTVCPPNYYGFLSDRKCYTVPNRPVASPLYFADNFTQTWVTTCPLTPLTFGERSLRYCISTCPNGSYADPSSRQCETACTDTTYFADSTTNKCVLICPINWLANTNSGQCENICTSGFAYELEHTCVGTCPKPYSGYDNTTAKVCVLRCPTNFYSLNRLCIPACPPPYYADNSTNECVTSCENSFASDDSRICVPTCAPFPLYFLADNSTNTCVNLCPSEPDFYSQNNICVKYCAPGSFADPTPTLRQCTSLCTTGLFSDPLSGRCLPKCPLTYWAQNVTNNCLQVCTSGFADNVTGLCVLLCPPPTYADSLSKRCVKICPVGYFGEVNYTCVNKCTLPNYANPLSRLCEPTCPPFGSLFAENTTAACVLDCSIVPFSYADRNINACVRNCTLPNQYMLDGAGICTSLCPLGLLMENSTETCEMSCLTGFAEPTTRYCVARCFGNPQTYGYLGVCHYRCLNASHNLYADNSTNLCVPTCPISENTYSDPLSGNCVLWCPDGYFAQDTYRTCSPTCVTGYADNLTRKCVPTCPTVPEQTYADLAAHKCVRICPPGFYAENISQHCVAYNACPTDNWSDEVSKYCVARCPSEPLTFGLNSSSSCVPKCPSSPSLFGDHQTQTCRTGCPTALNGEYRYADPTSRTCVFVCPIAHSLYGDSVGFACVVNCSGTQKRDNSTQRCVSLCPSNPSYWANLHTMDCVYHCPANEFASNQADRLCVPSCSVYLTYGDKNAGECTSYCPLGYFSDNYTYLCVDLCPSTPDYFADNTTRRCVLHCPAGNSPAAFATNWTTFADPTSRRCVTECPLGSFAQNSTQRCVPTCPPNEYADPITRVCVAECTVRPHYYKHTNRTCLFECPLNAYKLNDNHSCVYTDALGFTGCPGGQWANPLDNTCTSLCPPTYFADQTRHLCVQNCPASYFADNVTRLCTLTCSSAPEEYRLSLSYGYCVQFCPSPYYADNSTYNCVQDCPSLLFSYNITRTCVGWCPPPFFSHIYTVSGSRECILYCPTPYFAQDSTRSCELACVGNYSADDSTNRCVLNCPESPNYYALNNVCRSSCPSPTFEDNSTRRCVTQCPTQPQTFADNSTNKCVFACPSIPNYYADNTTMTCVFHCPPGSFVDVSTRSCVLYCPAHLNTYADPTTGVCQSACPSPLLASDLTKQCVPLCPNTPVKTYAYNGSCVFTCPSPLYAQNVTRTCISIQNCAKNSTAFSDPTSQVCVSTCPYGYYADNDTSKCVLNCPSSTFADNMTRICLDHCPPTHRLYADFTTTACVNKCPSLYFGNNLNWTCIRSCPIAVSGYILNLSNLCVEQCPSPYFAFVPNRTCVQNCGAGLFGDVATRICRDCPTTCPTCLSLTQCLSCTPTLYLSFGVCLPICTEGTYANNNSMSCVFATSCPPGLYGNNDTWACSSACPTKQYTNATTKRCEVCPEFCASCTSPSVCLTCTATAAFANVTKQCYAYCNATHNLNFNSSCYQVCPDGSYLDYTNVNCQSCNAACLTCSLAATNCTSCDSGFLFNQTCLTKCPEGYYAGNQTCLLCTSTVTACSKPLTFNVSTSTENYQNVVYIQFNQDAIIKGDPTKFISLNLKVTRRLQNSRKTSSNRQLDDSYSSLVNGGLPFTAQVMADGTIKIILSPGVSLTNPSFTVSINDPSMITTTSGDSLQTLEANLDNLILNSYPAGSTTDAPMVVAGTILSVVMLILLASVFLCSPLPVFLTLEAFQMIAFYAYVTELPPNLFYFMQKLSLTRLGFLPNIFSSVYIPPQSYTTDIPSRVIEVDQKLSFTSAAGSYFFVLLIYGVVSVVIYLLTTKNNTNRPLRELFTKIYNTRIKMGVFNDFLWMFMLNIVVSGFMQFRYTANSSEVAIAVISLLLFIGSAFALFLYRVKKYDPSNQQMVNNFRFWHEGVKEGPIYQYTIFFYYLRKLLFGILVAATLTTTAKTQNICLIFVASLMFLTLLIIRPYTDHLRNVLHIANEVGLIFLGGAFLYYKHYVDILEPVGTKIICGSIITIVIIVHLSIALVWGIFRAYHFYKQLYKDFKETELYRLYFDEKYEETLEKELQELNDETGEVQSVELTKVAPEDINEHEEIIKLKIKRRRKIEKKDEKDAIARRILRERGGEYIKLENVSENELEIEPIVVDFSKKELDFLPLDHASDRHQILENLSDHSDKTNSNKWEQYKNNHTEHLSKDLSAKDQGEYQQINVFDNISMLNEEPHPVNFNIAEEEEISSVSNKEEVVSKEDADPLRESIRQIDNKLKEQSKANIKQFPQEDYMDDFDMIESNAGDEQHPADVPKKEEPKPTLLKDLQPEPIQTFNQEQPEVIEHIFEPARPSLQPVNYIQHQFSQLIKDQPAQPIRHEPVRPNIHQFEELLDQPVQPVSKPKPVEPIQEPSQPIYQLEEPIIEEPVKSKKNQPEPQPQAWEEIGKANEEPQWQKVSDWQEILSDREEKPANKYQSINLDENVSKLSGEEERKERQRQEVKRSDKWDLDIADLLDEEEKKETKVGNKKHLLLFDEEDFE